MLTEIHGNILEVTDCDAICNTINTDGVMGKGLALLFKNKYPIMFKDYKDACFRKRIAPGDVWLWVPPIGSMPKLICNCATKNEWRFPSSYYYITTIMNNLVEILSKYKIKSIGVPHLGCGLGGLDWDKVHKIIKLYHDIFWEHLDVRIYN